MTLYGVVGQTTKNKDGGFNGGGSGALYNVFCFGEDIISYGGGGATHIGFLPGLLSSLQSKYSSHLLLVAGGGGGSINGPKIYDENYHKTCFRAGGSGGGFAGQRAGIFYSNNVDFSKPSGFGFGGSWTFRSGFHGSSGGGSGLRGGNCGNPGGGGSGYINTMKLKDSFLCGYKVHENNQHQNKTFSTENISSNAISKYAKIGNGHIRITCISKD